MAYGSILQQSRVKGTDQFERLFAGLFLPQNTGVPTSPNYQFDDSWVATRTGVGTFSVSIESTGGFTKPVVAATQNLTPKTIKVTMCVDPAGVVQNLNCIAGPVTHKANKIVFTIFVFKQDTGALSDVTQPGSPTLNGTFVNWYLGMSELKSMRVPFKGGF